MRHVTVLSIILLMSFLRIPAFAQPGNGPEKNADLLHRSYRFGEALVRYRQLLENTPDSLDRIRIENKIVHAENGKNLLEFVSEPKVIARKKAEKKNFYLSYPGFPDGSWVPVPRNLMPAPEQEASAVMYFPEGAEVIYYSAPDNSGSWNIYTSRLQDTVWSAPKLLNENITSVGNELFPILGADGKSLYFSSDGHYGTGGYDLYVSRWDEDLNDWGVPQNMGFPYSSPANDYLFYNTPDGLYSLLASDREFFSADNPDSLTIYAMEFENMPLKKSATEEQARLIGQLNLSRKSPGSGSDPEAADPQSRDTTAAGIRTADGRNAEFSEYNEAVTLLRKLQQELRTALKQQQENRNLYNTLTNSDDLAALEKKIGQQEQRTLLLQQQLNEATDRLQKIEIEFLSKGIIFTEEPETEANRTEAGEPAARNDFRFASSAPGKEPHLSVEIPEPVTDLSFKILEEAVIAPPEDFPEGLVYQIRLFVLSNKASLKSLKGLSPVFERKSGSRYIYTAGTFPAYGEALSNLNKVKKLGFSSAFIVAYNGGKSIPIKNARLLEKQNAENALYQVIISGYPEGLPEELLRAIRTGTEKDIAKTIENGTVKFVIGPFGKQSEAKNLAAVLKAVSNQVIEVEKINK